MKTIVFLADSVNRRYLSMYGNKETITPNLERLSRRSHIFDNHWTGSSPCMPARRDLLTGRLGFLERNWGPVESFDHTLPEILSKMGIRSHIETDHYHYAELGGEGYCQSFTSWKLHRGQENDNVEWMQKDSEVPDRIGKVSEYYEESRRSYKSDKDFPSARTYQGAADWLKRHGNEDDYLLWIEGFDPHEPFDVPDEYLELYGDNYTGTSFEWPKYEPFTGTPEELVHIRNRYSATLTLTDRYIGKVLDVCDELNLWDDTMIIFTSDHGYMLGEHGLMAKNYMQAYNEVFHIPLTFHLPGQKSQKRINALTQNIDIFPTITSYYDIDESEYYNPIHGKNLFPLMNDAVDKLRDGIIYGLFGKSVNVNDGRFTFFKCPENDSNSPLNLLTSMPTTLKHYIGVNLISDIEKIELGKHLSWTNFPVYKIPSEVIKYGDNTQSFALRDEYHDKDYLFDLKNDYNQEHNLGDVEIKERMIDLLKNLLVLHDSPKEQFVRLGLKE